MSKRLTATMLCLACVGLAFHAAAQAGEPTPQPLGVGGLQKGAKHDVRHPGRATGRAGGVGPQSSPKLPSGTRFVRSPGIVRRRSAPQLGLDAIQNPVLERVNYHRALAGLAPVMAEGRLLQAAQSHASYLVSTDEFGHYEDKKTNPHYTGHSPFDRLDAAHYDYAEAGEVVARQPSMHPGAAVDALVGAIYHRFIILAAEFAQAGPGASLSTQRGADELYVTVDFGSAMLPSLRRSAALTVYPADRQLGVPTDFDPSEEFPDPMPGQALAGYPVSVQVDARHRFAVKSFSLHRLDSSHHRRPVPAKLLTNASDPETPSFAAALIPLSPLAPSTTYRAAFSGSVDRRPVSRSWQFTTAHPSAVTMSFAVPTVVPGGIEKVVLHGLDTEKGPYYLCYAPAQLIKSIVHESETHVVVTTTTKCDAGASCEIRLTASYRSSCTNPFAGGTFTVTR